MQIFAWALSRIVSAWLWPLARTVGLASEIRPQLVTRAMRSTLRLLGQALAAPPPEARWLLPLFAHEVHEEVRSLETRRADSFSRLEPLLKAA